MPELGEVYVVQIRDVFPHEAKDFTPWLGENLSRLGSVLGMDLELAGVETDVGDFAVDVLARDLATGRPVVIEGQFGATNHDHLGKLITYAAGLDAAAAIWITETLREEHRQAIEWLNRRTDSDLHFFAVVLSAHRIDQSRPALVFRAVSFPNETQRAARDAAERQPSSRGESYRRYFQLLIDELREKHRFTGARTGLPQNWYSFRSDVPGFAYGTSFAQGERVRAEVYIDSGDAGQNKQIFDQLLAQRSEVERLFGEPLTWERLDGKRASRVACYRSGTIEMSEEDLSMVRAWAIDRLLRLKAVFGPRLQALEQPTE